MEKKRLTILGIANGWAARKGFADFLELRKRLSPDEYDIVMIGLTKDKIASLPQGIHGITRTENVEQLVEYYTMADIFFNPTWEDNYPTTNLEAIACGTPVITYKTGGSVESVTEKTGWIVEQGDLDHVVDIITKIKSVDLFQYEQDCIEYANSFFDKGLCFERYIELYQNVG